MSGTQDLAPIPAKPAWLRNWLALHTPSRASWMHHYQYWRIYASMGDRRVSTTVTPIATVEEFLADPVIREPNRI